jgi:hypothetical protein
MNPSFSKKKEDKKEKEKEHDEIFVKWTSEQEELLAEWSEKATCYRWLHSRSEKRYRARNYLFTIPVIILSTLTGTANFAMDSFVPEDNKQIAMAAVGATNIFAGILSTLQNFLRYAELMESHRASEVQWSKFGRNIAVELALDPKRRKPANDFLKISRAEYDRLIEQSPTIDDPIIKQFKASFKNTDIQKPDMCNGLDKCKIYIPTKEEKLENVLTNVSEKLLKNKSVKKWNVNKPTSENTKKSVNNEVTSYSESKKSAENELSELMSVGRVSSFKTKIKALDESQEPCEEEKNPMGKINQLMETLKEEPNNVKEIVDDTNKEPELEPEPEPEPVSEAEPEKTNDKETNTETSDNYNQKICEDETESFLSGIQDEQDNIEEEEEDIETGISKD